MQPAPTHPLLRRASYVALGGALVLLAAYAIQRTRDSHSQQDRLAVIDARIELQLLVEVWEKAVLSRTAEWLVDLGRASDPGQTLERIQRTSPWVEAVYRWDTSTDGDPIRYPVPPLDENIEAFRRHPCLQRVEQHEDDSEAYYEQLKSCRPAAAGPRLYAASRAADMLSQDGRNDLAVRILAWADVPLDSRLAALDRQGVAATRVVACRLQRAEGLGAMGDVDTQRSMLVDVAADIASADGPLLERLHSFLDYPIRADLQALDAQEELELVASYSTEARRRLDGWREVRDRLSVREASAQESLVGAVPLAPRVVQDPFDDLGYVLLYALVDEEEGTTTAVQLHAKVLVNQLLAERNDRSTAVYAVLDATGVPVVLGGAPPDASGRWVEVPFSSVLPKLRLARWLPQPSDETRVIEMASQLLPVVMALILGLMALLARGAAERETRELVARQQAFITRVTHELKTPLAGIRVMAETLQMGALRDPVRAEHFLDRILHESVRLGERIDEVLRVAQRPVVRPREPVQLDEVAAELVEDWEPRFEEVGALLESELRPVATVTGDPALLRDAVNNLLDNALKYLSPDRPGSVVIRTWQEGRNVFLEVVDNGLGVPAAARRRIFHPFERVEGAGRGKAGGHGLGLSFVAETIRGHGGTVECREGIEGGARFTIRLRSR